MRKEADYIKEYLQELKELEAFKNDESEMFETDDSADLKELHLRIKHQGIVESQSTGAMVQHFL